MNSPDPGTSQHRYKGLRDHRHINNHPVAISNALLAQHISTSGHLVLQLCIADLFLFAADSTVIDNRCTIAVPGFNMTVNSIITAIDLTTDKPAIKGRVRIVKHCRGRFHPIDIFCRLCPKPGRILACFCSDFVKRPCHCCPPSPLSPEAVRNLLFKQQFKPEPSNVQMVCGGMGFVVPNRGMVLARQAVNLL